MYINYSDAQGAGLLFLKDPQTAFEVKVHQMSCTKVVSPEESVLGPRAETPDPPLREPLRPR